MPSPRLSKMPAALAALAVAVAALAAWSGAAPLKAGAHQSAKRGGLSVPLAARGSLSAALGNHEPGYRVVGLHAKNRAQRLGATFSPAGVTVASGASRTRLGLVGYGHASGRERTLARVVPRATGNRVDYVRDGVDEWYANGPLGVEQGFDVGARPATGSGPLTLSVALSSDLHARLDHSGVVLAGAGRTLRYGALYASDAHGRTLHSWLQLQGGRIEIRIDDRNAAYPVRVDPLIQSAELTESDGGPGSSLGISMAMDGDTIVAAGASQSGPSAGKIALYVFVKPASGWANATQTAELTLSDIHASDSLGAVAISGDTIVAGATNHTAGAIPGAGAAYVFVKPASGWRDAHETAVLTATDGAVNEGLGNAVRVSGDTIVAGAEGHKVGTDDQQGAAYVFVKPASGWEDGTQKAELTATDGGANDLLGFVVAISGDTVALGAPFHQVGLTQSGAAYVFVKPSFGWPVTPHATETAELTPSDGATNDRFGIAVGVSGDSVIAGALLHQVGANQSQGAAYLFNKPGNTWKSITETQELTAADGAANDVFGDTVAISGNLAVASGPFHQSQGALYLFGLPPTVTIATPSVGTTFTQGQAVPASYACTAPAGASITACTGPVASGSPVDTAAPGQHSFTINASDSDGLAATQTVTYTVAPGPGTGMGTTGSTPPKPSITALRQTHPIWRTGGKLAEISRRHPPLGTTFSFTLNEQARVVLRFTRLLPGLKLHGKCVNRTARNSRKPHCTQTRVAGRLSLAVHVGANHLRFQGRLAPTKRLTPGTYTLTITATDGAGQTTTSHRLTFTIVK